MRRSTVVLAVMICAVPMAAAVDVTEYLCRHFGIQRQCPRPGDTRVIRRLLDGGRDCVGVFGHCHAYSGKRHDPGIHIFEALDAVGFVTLDFASEHGVEWYAHTSRISPTGVLGDPTKASVEKGREMWEVMISHLTEFVEILKPMSLAEIHERRS
jgi:hypothetical protein